LIAFTVLLTMWDPWARWACPAAVS